jgi:hypothetical protein
MAVRKDSTPVNPKKDATPTTRKEMEEMRREAEAINEGTTAPVCATECVEGRGNVRGVATACGP